jgi:hypothetical protein
MRRGFLLIWTLVTAAIAGIAGVLSYQAGYAAGLATKIPAGAGAVAPYWFYGFHPIGFGFFGLFPLLLFILLVFLLIGAFRRGRWGRGWGYPGYPGYPNYPGGPPPHVEQRMKEWHERAHGEQPPPATTA